MPLAGQEIVPRRHLEHAFEQGADGAAAQVDRVVNRFDVPSGRHPRGEERLHLRRDEQGVVVHRVEQRLDAEPVAAGEQRAMRLVPQHEGELPPQAMETVGAEVLIEMERDLAIGSGAQSMALLLQLPLNGFEPIELPIHDDMLSAVFAGDRLVPGGEVDDAEPGVAQADRPIGGNPYPLPIRSPVIQGLGGLE